MQKQSTSKVLDIFTKQAYIGLRKKRWDFDSGPACISIHVNAHSILSKDAEWP